ncbi:Grx4 family monothiol glutaredoxin [Methylomonas paludis]|uniref:Grx4 family monothiol glutaredoxin n=1 Tax=Methylomonas paludis TaxID=1173101 RepID=A0A975MNT5_9GAMM|nr:Grx4 family monothiol glutaredoxin [Methylomonas paludis]QWF71278.1 Grx4 family monothiol glutaredoxin [Methylomonas paludis]
MSSSTKDKILKQIAENPIILYMKGVPSAPECGFSAKAVAILNTSKVPYTYVDVLRAPFIRDKLPTVSKWPTFPQLFVNGELIGGCDIIETLDKDGVLLSLLQSALPKSAEPQAAVISHSEVDALIVQAYPDAIVHIVGEGCNLEIAVISDQFADLSLIKQHQGVMAALNEPLASGRLHAVTLKTYTQAQWQAQQSAANPGLLQIQV